MSFEAVAGRLASELTREHVTSGLPDAPTVDDPRRDQRPRYDLTVALTYYAPYVSGLTETARRVAEGMAARGWRVAVAATQHDPAHPRRETIAGVDVYRSPVVGRISRTPLAPGLPWLVRRLARQSGVLHLNLPMADGALIARLAATVPIVSMLHIDLHLPPGPLSRVAMAASDRACRAAIRRSAAVVAYSADQAEGSKFWPLIRKRRFEPIPAPCLPRGNGTATYRRGTGLHIGFMGRIVEDKGIEYLVRAFQQIDDPQARLLIAGNYSTVAGGSNIDRIRAVIGGDHRVEILGELHGQQIDDFYASIDVFALPSVAESFGIVQAEAMMAGVPSVTTDLPGGRYPVHATGFGRIAPPRDPDALAAAIRELTVAPTAWRAERARAATDLFNAEAVLDAHEDLFRSLLPYRPGLSSVHRSG
jgi:glycosyltransferase involved in cell wall biosynthesis